MIEAHCANIVMVSSFLPKMMFKFCKLFWICRKRRNTLMTSAWSVNVDEEYKNKESQTLIIGAEYLRFWHHRLVCNSIRVTSWPGTSSTPEIAGIANDRLIADRRFAAELDRTRAKRRRLHCKLYEKKLNERASKCFATVLGAWNCIKIKKFKNNQTPKLSRPIFTISKSEKV